MNFTYLETEAVQDTVLVYDGASTSSESIGEYSGDSLPDAVYSTGNSLYVKFTTDSSNAGGGFTMFIKALGM